jgi:RimJ/RimL family protein N-acetyltransferase
VPPLPESLVLRGEGVVLRDWRDEDEAALAPLFGDPDLARFLSLPAEYSREAALAHLANLRRGRAAGEILALAVAREAGGAPVGNVNLVFRFGAGAGACDAALGYWITPAARRRGIAVPACRLLCAWGFAELGLTRIELLIDERNAPSHRVARRLGARRDGVGAYTANGRTWELARYSLRQGSLTARR